MTAATLIAAKSPISIVQLTAGVGIRCVRRRPAWPCDNLSPRVVEIVTAAMAHKVNLVSLRELLRPFSATCKRVKGGVEIIWSAGDKQSFMRAGY